MFLHTHTECLYFSTGFLSTTSGRWIGTTWTRPKLPKSFQVGAPATWSTWGCAWRWLEWNGWRCSEIFGDVLWRMHEIVLFRSFPGLHCLHILFLFGTSQVHFFGFWDWFPQTMAAGVWPWFSFIFPFCGLTECFWTMIFWVWGVPNVYPLYPYSSHVMLCIRNS